MSFVEKLNGVVKLSPRVVSWIKKLQDRIWDKYENRGRIIAFCNLFSGLSEKGVEVTSHLLLLIPNLLSLVRLCILPVFLMGWLLGAPRWFYPVGYLLLMLLDVLDGPIARQCILESMLGKALDPLADKVAHLSILLTAVFLGLAPVWLFVVLLVKEAILFITSPNYKKTGVKWWGKIGTLTETIVLLAAFLFYPLPMWLFITLATLQIAILFAYVISNRRTVK